MEDEDLKAALLTPRIDKDAPGEPVPLPDLGLEVRVRALSRDEVLTMRFLKHKGILKTEKDWEQHMLSLAMVHPRMTAAEIGEWQKAGPGGEMNPVAEKVTALSKLDDGADKSGLPDVREESGDRVRVLPSDQAGDDGSAFAEGNESG